MTTSASRVWWMASRRCQKLVNREAPKLASENRVNVDSARALADWEAGSCDNITPVRGVNMRTRPVPSTAWGSASTQKVESVLNAARIHMTNAITRNPSVPTTLGSIRCMYRPIVRLSRMGATPTGASTRPAHVAV